MRATGAPLAGSSLSELPEPSWRLLLGRGLPSLTLEGFLPILVFYAAWRLGGLGTGIAASAAAAGAVVLWQSHRGLDVGLAAVSCLFVAVQALVALAAHSATVYLAQPVLFSACWGVAYLVSAAIRRPLIGTFAQAWYPFPPAFRQSDVYLREFGMQSVVWGVYSLGRSGLRLGLLLAGGIGGFVVVSFVTGTPVLVALVLWGVWHARRVFSADEQVGRGQPGMHELDGHRPLADGRGAALRRA